MRQATVSEYRAFLEIARLETQLIQSCTGERMPLVHRAVVSGCDRGPVVIARRTPIPGGFYFYEIDPGALDGLRAIKTVGTAVAKLAELDVSDSVGKLLQEQAAEVARLADRANHTAGYTLFNVGEYLRPLIELRKLLTDKGVIK